MIQIRFNFGDFHHLEPMRMQKAPVYAFWLRCTCEQVIPEYFFFTKLLGIFFMWKNEFIIQQNGINELYYSLYGTNVDVFL